MADGWIDGELRTPDGATLHYYRRGSGPSLVLAHGSSDSGQCWSRLAAALEGSFDIVAYDARSHGLSDTASANAPEAAADLVTVVETLGIEPTLAIGHSMGAATVTEALAERPDLFRAAALEDPVWMTEAKLAEVMELARKAAEAPADSPARYSSPPPDAHDAQYWAEAKRQHRPLETGRVFGRPWKERVERFRCPVLLLWGTTGLVTTETAAQAHRLSPLIHDVQIDAGHSIRYEAFEPYLAAVSAFFAGAPPTAPSAPGDRTDPLTSEHKESP